MKIYLVLLIALLSGCSTINPHGTMGERGQFWCNERYRNDSQKIWGEAEKEASLKGYMYGLAAALVLQREDQEDKEAQAHYFSRPPRLVPLDSPKRSKSGFEVTTFLLRPLTPNKKEEIIIAFAGSNDRADWITTNLNPFGKNQYNEAVTYTKKMLKDPRVEGRKIVISGISLGGGLVIHVLKDAELEPHIHEAWAINPSPKIYSPTPSSERMKKKTWLVYSDGEILSWGRSDFMTAILPGASKIEAGPNQTAKLGLIESNRIYAHFRWGIARQMLWIADYEMSRNSKNSWTEPLSILKESRFLTCQTERGKFPIKEDLQPATPKPDYSGAVN